MEKIKFEKVPKGIFNKVEDNKQKFVEKFIDELEELFPDTVKDGKVDFEALLERFGEYQDKDEKYDLTWVGKNKARQESFEDIVGRTLKYVEEDSKNPETTENLYIEGDNLEVLKLLRNSYYGKIKMIYIDPPYNTGNDFIYKDDFTLSEEEYEKLKGDVDEEGKRLIKNSEDSGRYHSNWLNMMYPRLQVARDLLTDDGIIFISIDDNEVHNMRKICDEIFGEENFVEIFSWQKTSTPPNLSYKTKKSVEYILLYNKHNCGDLQGLKKYSKSTNGLMNQSNKIGTLTFPREHTETSMKNEKLLKGMYGTKSYDIELLNDVEVKNGKFINDIKLRGKFKWSQDYLNNQIKNGTKIYIKTKALSPSYDKEEYDPEKPWNIIDKSFGVGTNVNASEEVDRLFFTNFSENLYPKPVSLISYLISMLNMNNEIILDFFSGSATTAHAVMDLNAKDGGNRKFIMVQLPEPTDKESVAYKEGYENICEIGKERIRRAGDKILEENKDKEGIEKLDTGFKVFKVDDTNFKRIKEVERKDLKSKYRTLSKKDIEDFNPHFTDIDVVYELMLRRQDIELTEEVRKLDYIGDRTYLVGATMLVSLEETITEKMVEQIGNIDADLSWIVLRDSAFDDDCDFKINTTLKLRSIIKESKNKNQKIYWI